MSDSSDRFDHWAEPAPFRIGDPPFREARGYLVRCPAGRELLKVALELDIHFRLPHKTLVGKGCYSSSSGHPVIEVKRYRIPGLFLSILTHELEHARQDARGLLLQNLPVTRDPESQSLLRRRELATEAGAMAKEAVVLCQLHHVGCRDPLSDMVRDPDCGNLIRHCHRIGKEDPAALYDGRAFRAVAEALRNDPERMAGYVWAAAYKWAAAVGIATASKYAYLNYRLYESSPEFQKAVHAEFREALPMLLADQPVVSVNEAHSPKATEIRGGVIHGLRQRLDALEYPPMGPVPSAGLTAATRRRDFEPTQ